MRGSPFRVPRGTLPPSEGEMSGRAQGTTTAPAPSKRRNLLANGRLIGAAVLAVVLLVFVLQNRRSVSVHFLFWSLHTGLGWMLLLAAVLGLLIGFGLQRLRRFL